MERKAEEFNNFFANVGKNTFELTQESLRNSELGCPQLFGAVSGNRKIDFRPQPVSVETVMLTIKSFKETRSVGCDGISLQFIRGALYVVVFYLTFQINTFLTTRVFPQQWKCPSYPSF